MKIISQIALISLCGVASAFTGYQPTTLGNTRLSMSAEDIKTSTAPSIDQSSAVSDDGNVMPLAPKMSQSMPFMTRPAMLTGELSGDVGFDPLGFAKSNAELMNYREAEVKHARLAMLAAAGWPISELFDKKLASVLGMIPAVDDGNRVPSLLNGGLGKVSPAYWVACIIGAAAIDLYGVSKRQASDKSYLPGDLGFDPLGVMDKVGDDGQKWMRLAEIKNGRLAMIAVVGFAFQEAITKIGVVDETPVFFYPLGQAMKMFINSGYIN